MEAYKTKAKKLTGTKYPEIYKKAFGFYVKIKKQSKRRTYIRSRYFKKSKIFLSIFWQHLHSKTNMKDKTRRLKFFPCSIELIQNTQFAPSSKENIYRKSEILHRFIGKTTENEIFFVQIKEDKRSGEKHLISVFPLG